MLDFQDPQIWWFLTRASAVVGWALMAITVIWGVLLKTRILRGADNPEWLKVTHRYISGLALAMIATHIGSLLLDEYISFGWTDVLIPFATSFEPFAVALGIFAFWLIILIQITALASQWLPEKVWKSIHLLSYASFVLVTIHSGLVGTDVGQSWYTILSLVLITSVTLAGIVRLVIAARAKPAPRVDPTPSALNGEHGTPRPGFEARVVDRVNIGADLLELTLTPVDPEIRLDWDSGSHLTVRLGNGLERQYSLCGDPVEQDSLRLGVLNTRGDGGGSTWIHEHVQVGATIVCDYPRNDFPLKPASRYQFIASGIGITAIRAMLHSIPARREWSLLYLGKSRSDMLFVDELSAEYGDRVTLWITAERGHRAQLEDLIDPDSDVYACGSPSLLAELEGLVAPERLHLERFQPEERLEVGPASPFTIVAARSGKTITVPAGRSALEALEQDGVSLQASCRRGTCGTCEVSVLAGNPQHRDSVMSDTDKDEMHIMFPCVSRAATETLTLDI